MKALSAILVAAFAAALFLLPKESEAATIQHCPNGLCEPVLLCPPWTTWDETTQQCRTVRVCPGESQVLITGGECELYCRAGREPDPFKPHHCRTAFKCPPGRVEIEPNVCEISCPAGERQNPWRQGVCRRPVSCSGELTEVSEGVCGCTGGKVATDESVCECPAEAPFDRDGVCEATALCHGGAVNDNNKCECPSVAPYHHADGACSAERYLAVRTFDDSKCPEGAKNEECRAAVLEARLEREFDISPIDAVRGNARALELGLSGAGVTIGVNEFNPYWKDDCAIGENTATLGERLVTSLDRNKFPAHVARPNEEVPARYANYEDGECDRGLVRTHSDFPSIRVAGGIEPVLSSFQHPEGRGDEPLTHAIATFGILAAQRNGYGIVGIAPKADYVAGAAVYDWDKSPDAEIVNYSIGLVGELPITSYAMVDERGLTLITETRENLLASLDPWSGQLRIDHVTTHLPADRRIDVIAAGNDGRSELGAFGGMPLYFPELLDNNLAVVAVGVGFKRVIAPYSNRCGLAGASFCLAAPVIGLTPNPDIVRETYRGAHGTSTAAPLVVGALALMKEYFNRMGGIGSHELVRRLLATADNSGIYADESIYGAGVLDLGNALTPQGGLQLLSGRSVSDSESHSLSQSGLRTGPAFGDSIGHALRDVQVAAFDKLNAPFPVAAAGLVQSEWESDSLRNALLAFQFEKSSPPQTQWDFANGFGWWSLRGGNRAGQPEIESVFGADNAYANLYSALAGDGMSGGLEWDSFRMEMFGETPGRETLARGAVGSFSFAPFSETTEKGGWIFHFGGVEEPNGFLSSSGSGAFGNLRSRTAFVGADYVGAKMNGWRIRMGGFAGDTSAENGEWFAGTESLRSDSFYLGLERENIFHSGDGLGFRLHQPLRASGSLKIRIPTGRTRYGDLTWREVSGKTSGRELSLEGLYRRSFEGGGWRVSAGAVSEPGHRAEAKTIGRLLFAFDREF